MVKNSAERMESPPIFRLKTGKTGEKPRKEYRLTAEKNENPWLTQGIFSSFQVNPGRPKAKALEIEGALTIRLRPTGIISPSPSCRSLGIDWIFL